MTHAPSAPPAAPTPAEERKKDDTMADVKLVTSLLVLALLALSAFLSADQTGARLWARAPESGDTLSDVTAAIFGKYVFAFELLSALLLAALVGAVAIALRDREEEA